MTRVVGEYERALRMNTLRLDENADVQAAAESVMREYFAETNREADFVDDLPIVGAINSIDKFQAASELITATYFAEMVNYSAAQLVNSSRRKNPGFSVPYHAYSLLILTRGVVEALSRSLALELGLARSTKVVRGSLTSPAFRKSIADRAGRKDMAACLDRLSAWLDALRELRNPPAHGNWIMYRYESMWREPLENEWTEFFEAMEAMQSPIEERIEPEAIVARLEEWFDNIESLLIVTPLAMDPTKSLGMSYGVPEA